MDYPSILQTAIDLLLSAALAAIVSWVAKLHRRTKAENDAIRDGVRALLYDRIVQGYLRFHDDLGYMPLQAKESMQDVYDNYKKLNGNGLGEQMYRKMKELPTSKDVKVGGTE